MPDGAGHPELHGPPLSPVKDPVTPVKTLPVTYLSMDNYYAQTKHKTFEEQIGFISRMENDCVVKDCK